MAIYTVIGDPHAKPGNLDKINTLFDIVEDLGNPVIWLGDLLDTKEVVRGKCLNTYLRRFGYSDLEHYVLVGNHDWFNLECKEHSLEPLRNLPNVRVIDEVFFIRNQGLCFLPYMHPEALRGWLRQMPPDRTVFCHADIKGFDYGNGLLSTEGVEASEIKARIISGHYHKYQEVGNITYLGTPFSHSFGETDQEKYIGIFNTDTRELQLLDTPFPRHITIELDCSQELDHDPPGEDFLRVILRGTQEEIDRVKRQDTVKYIEHPTGVAKVLAIDESVSPQAQFSKWAKDIKGYSDEILELGLEVMKDV